MSDAVHAAARDCVHCGFCLPACPTYQLWAEEMDSPRGRIHLLTQLLDGAELTAKGAEHFDRCLGCLACQTACPSGVRYDVLLNAARVRVEQARPTLAPLGSRGSRGFRGFRGFRGLQGLQGLQGLRGRAERAAIFALFPYPRRLRAATVPLRLARRFPARLAPLLSRVSPGLGAALRVAPPPPSGPRVRLPELVRARGRRRARVGMLTGCAQSVFFPRVNTATARVLAAEGCDVVIPPGQGCCGALSLHSGRRDEAARFARRTIDTFARAGVDAVVVNSAGCGSAMKEYGELLGTPGMPPVRDVTEFLAELGPVAPRHPIPLRAGYHDACHLAHAQRITAQPRQLLRGIGGLELVELTDAGTCCGSAGVYNLLQPEAAAELGRRKADAVRAAHVDLLVTANPGCALQIRSALIRTAPAARPVPILHPVELLDASIRSRRT